MLCVAYGYLCVMSDAGARPVQRKRKGGVRNKNGPWGCSRKWEGEQGAQDTHTHPSSRASLLLSLPCSRRSCLCAVRSVSMELFELQRCWCMHPGGKWENNTSGGTASLDCPPSLGPRPQPATLLFWRLWANGACRCHGGRVSASLKPIHFAVCVSFVVRDGQERKKNISSRPVASFPTFRKRMVQSAYI